MGQLIPAEYGTKIARFLEVVSDPQIMDVICYRIAEGETLRDLAMAWEIPYGKLSRWIAEDEGRSAMFLQTLEIRAHDLAEESIEIADTADTEAPMDLQKAKLQIDTRLKIASKWDRKRYGDDKTAGAIGNVTVVINRGLGSGNEYEGTVVTAEITNEGEGDAICERETAPVHVVTTPGDSEEVGARNGAGESSEGACQEEISKGYEVDPL